MPLAAVLTVTLACTFDPAGAPEPGAGETDGVCTSSWWHLDFPFRRGLNVAPAPSEYTVQLFLDETTTPTAQQLVAASQVPDGGDVRVVRRDQDGWEELDRHLVAFDADGVEIRFRIQEATGFDGTAGRYYLYYGNSAAGPPPADLTRVYLRWHDFESVALSSDGSPAFEPIPASEWRVVDDGGNRVYHAGGPSRHTARLAGVDLEDIALEARLKITAPDLSEANHNGLAIRASSLDPASIDTYVAQLRGNEQVSAIVTYRTGSFVTAGQVQSAPIEVQRWYQLRAELVDSTIDFYVDGTLVRSMANAEAVATGVGLFGFSCDVSFDDVSVRRLIAPEPGVTAAEQEICP